MIAHYIKETNIFKVSRQTSRLAVFRTFYLTCSLGTKADIARGCSQRYMQSRDTLRDIRGPGITFQIQDSMHQFLNIMEVLTW